MSVERSQVLNEGRTALRRELPLIAVNLVTGALIWLFGILIFLPLSKEFAVLNLVAADKLVAAVFMVALLVILFRLFGNAKRLADGLADIVAARTAGGADPDTLQGLQRAGRVLMYILLAVVAYLFFLPFLASVAFVLAGIILLVLAFWAVMTLFSVGNTVSDAIRHWADRTAERIDQGITREGDHGRSQGTETTQG